MPKTKKGRKIMRAMKVILIGMAFYRREQGDGQYRGNQGTKFQGFQQYCQSDFGLCDVSQEFGDIY